MWLLTAELRAGVIGVGAMGQNHARVLSQLRRVRLAGVADVDESRANAIAAVYGVPAHTDFRELLKEVDIATIATPTVTHCDVGSAALNAGVHALVEKPLASTPEEAQQLCGLAETNGVKLQVGHIERFNPAFRELPTVLGDSRTTALSARRLSPVLRVTDVDVVLDLMVHDLDIICSLVGDVPTYVDAVGVSTNGVGTDHAVAHLVFPDGTLGQLTAIRITAHRVRTLDIVQKGAHIELDYLSRRVVVHRQQGPASPWDDHDVSHREGGVLEKVFVPDVEPLQLELESFVGCVLGDTEPEVSGQDGLRAVELAHAIRQSIDEKGCLGSRSPNPAAPWTAQCST